MADHNDFNARIIEQFRANGGTFDGQTLLLLHHKGVKTGTERVNPLAYQKVGDAYAIFASAAGGPRDPQWFRNLLAHPDTTAEIGTEMIRVRARLVNGEERAEIWTKQKAMQENFAEYETKAAPREIPVVVLEPVA